MRFYIQAWCFGAKGEIFVREVGINLGGRVRNCSQGVEAFRGEERGEGISLSWCGGGSRVFYLFFFGCGWLDDIVYMDVTEIVCWVYRVGTWFCWRKYYEWCISRLRASSLLLPSSSSLTSSSTLSPHVTHPSPTAPPPSSPPQSKKTYIFAISFPKTPFKIHVNKITIRFRQLLVHITLPLLHANQADRPVHPSRSPLPAIMPSLEPIYDTSCFSAYVKGIAAGTPNAASSPCLLELKTPTKNFAF